ncbi:TPA: helix-turn-helix transcriptional regulator [Serratia fonticola]
MTSGRKKAQCTDFQLDRDEAEWHCHVCGQLLRADNGYLHIHTQNGSWLQSPHQAGWLPPGVLHHARSFGVFSAWSLSVEPKMCHRLPEQPCVFKVTPLLRALAQRAVEWQEQHCLLPEQQRISSVLWDELTAAQRESSLLLMPTDRRLLRIAQAIVEYPEDPRTPQEWAVWAGLSSRTLRRLFRAEVQLSFAQWRRQVRLNHAQERLLRGETVMSVAEALGYTSPSNFIAMFRRCRGDSPAHYTLQCRRMS